MKKIAILVLIGLLVYINTLPNSFVWDDEEQVVNNLLIRNPANFWQIFKGSTFQTGGAGGLTGMYYKPLMTFSFMLNYAIWRLNPFGFHLFQILLHIGNSILIFFLLKKLVNKNLAFWASLLFVVHPGNVEAVAYVSAVQEVLYTFFGLLALNLLFWQDRKRQYVLPGVILLSLLGKESGIAVITIGVVLALFLIRKRLGNWLFSSSIAFSIYLFLRFAVGKVTVTTSSVIPIVKASFWQRFLTVPYELFSYLRIFFFPKNLFISQHLVIRQPRDYRFWLYLIIVVVMFFLAVLLAIKKKSKIYISFLFWFVLSISLVLNLYPLDMTVAERWLYFPMIGLLGMLIMIFERLPQKKIILLLMIFLLSLRTIVRTGDWRNGLKLYSRDVRLAPNSFDLQNNLGVEYFRAEDLTKAKPYFERSIELEPSWWTSYSNLGVIYARNNDFSKAEEFYRKAIANGNYYLAHENLVFLVLSIKKPAEATKIIEESVAVLPYNERILIALALVYYKDGKQEKALNIAQKLYSLYPSSQNLILLQNIANRKEIKL